MRNVHVRFGTAPPAQTELAFAIDFARRISGRLFVWSAIDRAARALLERAGARDVEHAHVGDRVRLRIARMEAGLVPTFCQGDPYHAVHEPTSIIVGPRGSHPRLAPAVVSTMGETALDARGGGDICLPFANGESVFAAAAEAIPLAAAFGKTLLLYHTSWPKDGVPEGAPASRHMIPSAADVLERLQELADEAGVKHRVLVETAPSVAEGTVRAALNERCALIVLSRGRHVGCGSYVDQMLARSVIPVLVAGKEAA